MCNLITIPSVAWLRRAVRRWRTRRSTSAIVPSGHVAVCAEGARFMVRLAHLSHPAFLELLRQAEEEYGFPTGASGPVALPCDEDHLRDVLRRVSSPSHTEEPRRPSFCRRRRRGDSRPLLQGGGLPLSARAAAPNDRATEHTQFLPRVTAATGDRHGPPDAYAQQAPKR